jgi:hypothetical protein
LPQLSKQALIKNWLKEMVRTWPHKELDPSEVEHWLTDLDRFSTTAIDYAFDNWRRNGMFFPVYKVIIEVCEAWQPAGEAWKCSQECQREHGKGYHWNDMKWLFKRMQQEIAANRPINSAALLSELDGKRADGPPAWRRA